MESWFKLFGGFALVGVGIWLLIYTIKEIRHGYPDRFGNIYKLIFGAIFCIILGLVLIYQEAF
jgi:drug/metabolite transporter (DMT)-like permease